MEQFKKHAEIMYCRAQEYNNFFNILNNKEKNEIGFEKKNLIIFGENIDLAKNWYQKNYNIKFNYTKKKLNTN
jgi:urocanate hydratase